MQRWLAPLEVFVRGRRRDDAEHIGGKAVGLVQLSRWGLPVPETWVIPCSTFDAVMRELPPACEPRSLLKIRSDAALFSRAAQAQNDLMRAPFPRGLEDELRALCDEVKDRMPWGLAVRSSASSEDLPGMSMAGLAESYLGVFDAAGLIEAVRRVWASLLSGRSLSYLAHHRASHAAMGVVIQIVIPSRAAGVLFTRAPGRSDGGGFLVNVAPGLGTGVVSGSIEPHVVELSPSGAIVSHTSPGHRSQRIERVGPSGIESEMADMHELPISATQLASLAEHAVHLERASVGPWDVEFACDQSRVWLVQARRMTGQGFPEGGTATTVWSRANVSEALPGVATPLTWSIAGAFSETGFRQAFLALGCRLPKNTHLVGNVHGRFYLNLTEFMRTAAQVPWMDPSLLIELGGGSGADALADDVRAVNHRGFYARLPLTVKRLLAEQWNLEADVARFDSEADRTMRDFLALELTILPDDALARTMRDAQRFLERTGRSMLTCSSSALGAHLAVRLLLRSLGEEEAKRLSQSVTRGIQDLESARPAMALLRLAHTAMREPDAESAILGGATRIAVLPDGLTKKGLSLFIEAHGWRAVREAELSTPRWREDEAPVLAMLRALLQGGAKDPEDALARARTLAGEDLTRVSEKLPLGTRSILRHAVTRAQKTARLREQTRAWVTRALGMIRLIALEANRRLVRLMPELATTSKAAASEIPTVFFLTADEIIDALRSARTDLGGIVAARRVDFARYASKPEPPITFTGAPPPVWLPVASGSTLRGFAASEGEAEGRVRVLTDARDVGAFVPGEVLVVRATDVGWTPLFASTAAVVTELGGSLSHAAIVARELGVPLVTNVDGATRVLETGERVRVDGTHGLVHRVSADPRAAPPTRP